MKYCIFAITAMATTIVYGDKLIYDTGFSRREIMPPLCGYLVMDAFGNFRELPDLQSGEAMVLFSDGANLRYSVIPKPNINSPTVVYSNGTAKRAHPLSDEESIENDRDYILSTKQPKLTLEEKAKNEMLLAEIMAIHGATNKREFINEQLKKNNSGYYDEQKRKQNEALKAWGY